MKQIRRILFSLLLITAFTLTLTACGKNNKFKTFEEQLLAENFRLIITQNGTPVEIEVDGEISYYPEGQPTGGDSTMYYIKDLGDNIQQYYKTGDTWTVEEIASPSRIKGMSEAIVNKDNYEADGDLFRMPDGIIEGFTDCTLQFKEGSVIFSFIYQEETEITFEFSDFGEMNLTLPEV